MCLCRCSQSFTLKSPSHYGSTGSVQFCNSAPGPQASCPPDHMLCCSHCWPAPALYLPQLSSFVIKTRARVLLQLISSSRLTRSWSVMFPANVLCVHIHKIVENKGWVSFSPQRLDQGLTSKFIFLLILIIILLM